MPCAIPKKAVFFSQTSPGVGTAHVQASSCTVSRAARAGAQNASIVSDTVDAVLTKQREGGAHPLPGLPAIGRRPQPRPTDLAPTHVALHIFAPAAGRAKRR